MSYLDSKDGWLFLLALLVAAGVGLAIHLIDKHIRRPEPQKPAEGHELMKQAAAEVQQHAILGSYSAAIAVVRALVDARLLRPDRYHEARAIAAEQIRNTLQD